MITIPSLNDVTDILDTDMIMVTQQSGQSYKISGSELNKRGKIIIANSTTITGAPLKAGSSVRVYFTVDLTAANASTTLQLNYNGVNYYVKAPKNGALVNFVATNLGGTPTVYKYLQAYTTLELLFDGTQFVIIGNPVILSSTDYTIYADGKNLFSKYPKIIEDRLLFQSLGTITFNLTATKKYLIITSAGTSANDSGLYLVTPTSYGGNLVAVVSEQYFSASLSNLVLSVSVSKNINFTLMEI